MVKQELQVNPQESVSTDIITQAIQKGADLSQVRELLVLKKEYEADEARKAYHRAMTEFKKTPPRISKDKEVAFSQTRYNYATLANVVEKISAELSKHGLSASWITNTNGVIQVTCRITHELGHSEETTLSADADKSGAKNSIQAMGSTISYLERYTILALTGLAAHDQDDDGQSAVPVVEKIDEKQLHKLRDLLIVAELKEKPLCKFFKIESLEDLPKGKYQQAVTAIEAKKKVAK